MITNGQTINVYIPSPRGEGRLFITKRYPECSAAAHVYSHVGEENIEKQTPLYLENGTVFYLTPNVKKSALFFVEP